MRLVKHRGVTSPNQVTTTGLDIIVGRTNVEDHLDDLEDIREQIPMIPEDPKEIRDEEVYIDGDGNIVYKSKDSGFIKQRTRRMGR